jgi:hypothetical protein
MSIDNQLANQQEQFIEDHTSVSDTSLWIKPTLEVIGVSLECTAYAGARDVEE